MNVKTLYKRAIEVLVNNNLLITRYKYFNANFGNFSSPHPAMHISVLEGEESDLYLFYMSGRIHVKKYTYTRKSV